MTKSSKPLRRFLALTLVLFFVAEPVSPGFGQTRNVTPATPHRLIIHGGSSMNEGTRQILKKFGKAKNSCLVVIPTATSDNNIPTNSQLRKAWSKYGFKQIHRFHTRNPDVANDVSALRILQKATVVWFSGGDQNRLSKVYAGSKLESLIKERIEDGVLVGGSSAGAAIQSKVMIGGGKSEPRIGIGLDILPNSIIDQHFLERSRMNRLLRAVEAYPQRVGVGISESTSLVVDGDQAKVIGAGFVTLIRLDEKLDIQIYKSGESFRLSEVDLVSQKPDVETPKTCVNGMEHVESKTGLASFLDTSLTKAEQLRTDMTQAAASEPIARTLARLINEFLKDVPSFAKKEKSPWIAAATPQTLSEDEFIKSFQGKDRTLSATKAYQPFAGRWVGNWDGKTVRHHWSDTINIDEKNEPQRSRAAGLHLKAYQFAWIGDGYGVNLYSSAGQSTFLHGYVEHVSDGDFQKVTARRPHVGISIGNRLIWITAKEVFFESASYRGSQASAESYSIVGFHYETNDHELRGKGGFATQYARDSKSGTQFFKLPFKAAEPRRNSTNR